MEIFIDICPTDFSSVDLTEEWEQKIKTAFQKEYMGFSNVIIFKSNDSLSNRISGFNSNGHSIMHEQLESISEFFSFILKPENLETYLSK